MGAERFKTKESKWVWILFVSLSFPSLFKKKLSLNERLFVKAAGTFGRTQIKLQGSRTSSRNDTPPTPPSSTAVGNWIGVIDRRESCLLAQTRWVSTHFTLKWEQQRHRAAIVCNIRSCSVRGKTGKHKTGVHIMKRTRVCCGRKRWMHEYLVYKVEQQ